MKESRSIYDACSSAGLPSELCRAFERQGVAKLYDWQRECIDSVSALSTNNSLLYCAPTSGGKTLVAELVLLKNVIKDKKVAILILPYVSLVLEKETQLKKTLTMYNAAQNRNGKKPIRIKGFYGDLGLHRCHRHHVIICTIEKANGVINNFIFRNKFKDIGCVVIDESHCIGSKFNGYLLEMLIR